jgi:hypothetical protein
MAHQVSRKWEKTRNWEDAKSSFSRDENVLSFTRSPQSDHGATALNLVYQAAEVFSDMEEHARETEARAQSLCKSAVDRLQLAEKRIEVAERARREVTNDAECKLQDASRALRQAQKRIVAAEDQVTALEFRAQAAEAQLRETKQALLLVEEAIRTRLLSANSATVGNESTSAPRFVTV